MKTYNPTTPSRRNFTGILYRKLLTRTQPEKSLTRGVKRNVGRNSAGRITVRHKGSGAKRLHREVDFSYKKRDIPAKIESIEYDPNRTGFISLLSYADGEKRYALTPKGLAVGEGIMTSETAEIKLGNRLPLNKIPVSTLVFNIEIKPNSGAKLARSAGNSAEIVAEDRGYSLLKLPSGEIRKIIGTAWATIGGVSNDEKKLVKIGKAGRSRWMGIRPTVRGSAMSPGGHPFGGGEGRQGAGMAKTKNKWGKGFRGVKTRRVKKYSNKAIIERRKKKKK